jgi:hypothetical protein
LLVMLIVTLTSGPLFAEWVEPKDATKCP